MFPGAPGTLVSLGAPKGGGCALCSGKDVSASVAAGYPRHCAGAGAGGEGTGGEGTGGEVSAAASLEREGDATPPCSYADAPRLQGGGH